MSFVFRPATPEDWMTIAELLTHYDLPLEGAEAHLNNFILAWEGKTLVGLAGLECYEGVGLLRSVAVAQPQHGLGSRLVQELLTNARQQGLHQLILLTTTAAEFFPRFGFRPILRAKAPLAVHASAEFQGACPDTATVMQLIFEP